MCAIVKELWLALTSPIEEGITLQLKVMYPEKCDSSTPLYFVKTHHWKYAALRPTCTKGPSGTSVRITFSEVVAAFLQPYAENVKRTG